jgi:hypothetical protein
MLKDSYESLQQWQLVTRLWGKKKIKRYGKKERKVTEKKMGGNRG